MFSCYMCFLITLCLNVATLVVVTFNSSEEGNTQFPIRCSVLYYSDNVQDRNEQ